MRVFIPAPVPKPISSALAPIDSAISRRVFPQNLGLGARDVILGQLADFLEQLRAALIVKKFATAEFVANWKDRRSLPRENPSCRLEIEHRDAGRSAPLMPDRVPVECR